MDISKEELKQLMKAAVSEALKEFFEQSQEKHAAPKPKTPTYQEVFDDVMAKVARGELDAEEAGKIITQAYENQHKEAVEGPSYSQLSDKLNEFKSYLKDWENDLDHWASKSESTIEMMERMKTKVQTKEEEAKLYADMKKIAEIEAQAKADASLEEMKAKLRDK
ncbi:MAG: hypothetical protein ACPGJS_20520 [Flammeovirgaceae bacterium]